MADGLGQVLDEGAATGDVEQLHPAADAEDGKVALEGTADEGELEAIALGPSAPGLGVWGGAVGGRVDVRAAGEQQRVEPVE